MSGRAHRAARLLLAAGALACTAPEPAARAPAEAAAGGDAQRVICEEPRPQACTREVRPVCAERDTGVRCVTTPCPSSERVGYPNACSACSDPAVMSYVPGACTPNDR